MSGDGFLRHPLLAACAVPHGFGLRGSRAPRGMVRPRQVHGAGVARVRAGGSEGLDDSDAVVSDAPGVRVGVVTADCVPILMATPSGACVAAVHAGWRGLARGVVRAAVASLHKLGADGRRAVAVIGPHVGPCCYEIDAPVVDALAGRLDDIRADVLRPARDGHWLLDLGGVARLELERAGLVREAIARIPSACTACDPQRFHSYRRDGSAAGRLIHFVAAREAPGDSSLDSGSPPP